MTNTINPAQPSLATLASTPLTGQLMKKTDAPDNWFEAFAAAWGNALDTQAADIETKADGVANQGSDNPSQITMLTAASMKFGFLSNSSQSSIDAVSKALETMARKQ